MALARPFNDSSTNEPPTQGGFFSGISDEEYLKMQDQEPGTWGSMFEVAEEVQAAQERLADLLGSVWGEIGLEEEPAAEEPLVAATSVKKKIVLSVVLDRDVKTLPRIRLKPRA